MAIQQNNTFHIIFRDLGKTDKMLWLSKVAIRNLSPHLRNSAILRTTKLIAELLTKKSCGTAVGDLQKFDFRNSATFSSLLPVPLLSSPFSSAQDGFKNQPKIFVELSVSLETKNLP